MHNAAMAQAKWVDLDGPMHYMDHGGPDGAPMIVCVHGLGGSHANWASLAPLLTEHHRVLAVDLAGFGLTVGGPRSAAVPANRRLVDRFLAEVTDQPVVLVGNSMGGLISAMQAAKNPASVSHLVLVDPALPIPLHFPDPKVIAVFAEMMLPKRARKALARRRGPQTPESIARDLIALVCADPRRVDPAVLTEHIDLAKARSGDRHAQRDFLVAAQSLSLFLGTGRRRLKALLASISAPVLLLHGDQDRLINIRAARHAAKANPSWTFAIARGVGHVPQLEAPEWTAQQILPWLAAHPVSSRAAS
jgi:pimeloyl-ACP methyl ester carboxylesterase